MDAVQEIGGTVLATAPLAHGPFHSMGDVTRAHPGHFFDEATMRGFGSRIVDDYPIGGRFFRTTEQDRYGSAWGGQRRCSLRLCTNAGDIETVEDYGDYSTAGAKKVAQGFETVTLVLADPDEHGRQFHRVMLYGAKVEPARAGSAYYDAVGALQLYDDLIGEDRRRPLHEAIDALQAARHALYSLRDDKARAKVSRQVDALGRRRDVLVEQLLRAAGLEGR